MSEPITAVGAAAIAAYLGKDGLQKLLGPTASYLGEEIKTLVEKSHHNLGRIFKKAIQKLGNRIEMPGTVSPRVLKHVYEEGRFCEDDIAAEYFAGILAGSRSERPSDDRALVYIDTLKALSFFDIRLHYLSYITIRRAYIGINGTAGCLGTEINSLNRSVGIPLKYFETIAKIKTTEDGVFLANSSIDNLGRLHLILPRSELYTQSLPAGKKKKFIDVFPREFGANLFLWVHGYANLRPGELFNEELEITPLSDLDLPDLENLDIPSTYSERHP